mmetsp:Transcript_20422/g.64047  ORF Transcript_20422/g.64047 Transcript_20422/m.64047 type:complete len:138 (+) Transcript_20422:176-589(+)
MCEEARLATATHVGHKPIFRAAEKLLRACEEAAAPGTPPAGGPLAGSGRCGEASSGVPPSEDSLERWLWEVDDEGHLLRYLEPLRRRFADSAAVVAAYRREAGLLDPRLFQELGVERLGHRRLFEVWFRDRSRRGAP